MNIKHIKSKIIYFNTSITLIPNKHYSGWHKKEATKEHLNEKSWDRNMESKWWIQLHECGH